MDHVSKRRALRRLFAIISFYAVFGEVGLTVLLAFTAEAAKVAAVNPVMLAAVGGHFAYLMWYVKLGSDEKKHQADIEAAK